MRGQPLHQGISSHVQTTIHLLLLHWLYREHTLRSLLTRKGAMRCLRAVMLSLGCAYSYIKERYFIMPVYNIANLITLQYSLARLSYKKAW